MGRAEVLQGVRLEGLLDRKRNAHPTNEAASLHRHQPAQGSRQGVRVPSNLPIDGHSFRRVEVLTGTPRRRWWSAAEKATLVAESLAPGAVTSAIALSYGLHRNQLYGWRREFRSAAVADAGAPTGEFVPIVAENRTGSVAAAILRLAARSCVSSRVSSLRFSARCSAC
jgi:transposase-like protein